MTARLHCFAQSGHSYKAALALTLSDVEWTPVWVDFFNGEARGPAFRALNPMGECPVLEIDDLVLTQSGVMLDYVSEQTGQFRPQSPAEHRENLRWILWENHKLNAYLGVYRFLSHLLPEDKRPAEAIAFMRGRALAALKTLDAHLADRDWIAADRPLTADIACAGYVFYPEQEYGWSWGDWPNLQAWKARIAVLPGWAHPYDLTPGAPDG